MKKYICTWCWKEFEPTGVLSRMQHESCFCYSGPDRNLHTLLNRANAKVEELKKKICQLTNQNSMCCQNNPCNCAPCIPDPKHFVGDIVLISSYAPYQDLSGKQSLTQQVKIDRSIYKNGWVYLYNGHEGNTRYFGDCDILKNYTYQEEGPQKQIAHKKSK